MRRASARLLTAGYRPKSRRQNPCLLPLCLRPSRHSARSPAFLFLRQIRARRTCRGSFPTGPALPAVQATPRLPPPPADWSQTAAAPSPRRRAPPHTHMPFQMRWAPDGTVRIAREKVDPVPLQQFIGKRLFRFSEPSVERSRRHLHQASRSASTRPATPARRSTAGYRSG